MLPVLQVNNYTDRTRKSASALL